MFPISFCDLLSSTVCRKFDKIVVVCHNCVSSFVVILKCCSIILLSVKQQRTQGEGQGSGRPGGTFGGMTRHLAKRTYILIIKIRRSHKSARKGEITYFFL